MTGEDVSDPPTPALVVITIIIVVDVAVVICYVFNFAYRRLTESVTRRRCIPFAR